MVLEERSLNSLPAIPLPKRTVDSVFSFMEQQDDALENLDMIFKLNDGRVAGTSGVLSTRTSNSNHCPGANIKEYVKPSQNDVLFGPGGMAYCHPGNQRFRGIQNRVQPQYLAATRPNEKSTIMAWMIGEVKSNGARFLKPDEDRWIVASDSMVTLMVGQALRGCPAGCTKTTSKKRQSRRDVANPKIDGRVGVNEIDVLFGRGGRINQHPGNQRYREIRNRLQTQYLAATRPNEKSAIVVRMIGEVQSNGARFLTHGVDRWIVASNSMVRRKVGQALRERATNKKRKT